MSSKRKSTLPMNEPNNSSHGAASSLDSTPAPISQKRQRVSRACDQCRIAREKCDGLQPLCYSCVSQNRECTYRNNPKKRGVQTGYIRTLEIALSWVLEKVPGGEQALSTLLTHEGGRGRMLLAGQDKKGADRLYKKWTKSKVYKEIDRILSSDANSPPLQDENSLPSEDSSDSEADAEKSVIEPTPTRSDTGWEASSFYIIPESPQVASLQGVRSRPYYTSVEGTVGQSHSSHLSHLPQRLQLPTEHWRLLDIYFSYSHSWLPILEKQDIFQATYLYSENGLILSPRDPAPPVHSELWAALTLAAFQDAASSQPISRDNTAQGATSPDEIYAVARSFIPSEEGPFQLQHARALLLLGLVNLGRGKLITAWMLVGYAVRILLEVDSNQQDLHSGARQKRQSVYMACFILDTFISVRCGKPSHLRTDDLPESIPIPENDLDEWQPWSPCAGFGPRDDWSRPSRRSPAHGLSTFHQIYDIMKVVKEKAPLPQRHGRARLFRPGQEEITAIDLFQQSINPRSPFAKFATGSDLSPAPVPSLYAIRFIYLWASAMLVNPKASHLRLTLDTLEQYASRFGACGAPPFVTACFDSFDHLIESSGLHEGDKQRLASLRTLYSSIWSAASIAGPWLSGTQPYLVSPNTERDHALNAIPRRPTLDSNTFPQTPASFSFNTSMAGDHPSANGPYPPLNVPDIVPMPFQTPKSMFHPSALILPQQSSDQHQTSTVIRIPTMGTPDPHHHHHMIPIHNSDMNNQDHDALLDELASIDHNIDRIDVDPQFMANLGFAPGCDPNELLTR